MSEGKDFDAMSRREFLKIGLAGTTSALLGISMAQSGSKTYLPARHFMEQLREMP
jgi:hypothetical protein